MSDEEEFRRKKTDITVKIDRSAELEGIEKELAEEKVRREEAEETLRLVAQKELEAKLKSVGLPEDATLEDYQREIKKKAPSGSSPSETLYWQQNIHEKDEDIKPEGSLGDILVDNSKKGLEDSIEYLNYMKSHGSESQKAEARRLLGKAEKTIFSKNKELLNAEFEGDIHSLTRHEVTITDKMTDEQKAKAEEYNSKLRRERSKWVQK